MPLLFAALAVVLHEPRRIAVVGGGERRCWRAPERTHDNLRARALEVEVP